MLTMPTIWTSTPLRAPSAVTARMSEAVADFDAHGSGHSGADEGFDFTG